MISVIIPVLNEERLIGDCIESVRQSDVPCEIIIADGGSSDRTVWTAERFQGVKVVIAESGRGMQMNAGAAGAAGEVLVFLHADTILDDGWGREITEALKDSAVVGGAFTFAISNRGKQYRAVELWVKLRCILFRLPYGDQGIFVRKEVFQALGGYREIPLMEDVDLVGRMKKRGNIVMLEARAFTSGRRWESRGFFRTAAINQLIMFLYRAGVSPDTLAKIYYR